MAKPRQEWAAVEWHFLRFDPRFRALDADIALAYLKLWATCIHLRRDRFELAEINGTYLPDIVGVTPELFRRMVARCCTSSPQGSLLSKGPRGSVTVNGVRTKHRGLSGWNENPLRLDCDVIATQTETETKTGTGTRTKTKSHSVGTVSCSVSGPAPDDAMED